MNREIKFRGQRIDNNEWVYGYYYTDTHFNGFSKEKEEMWTKSFIRAEKGTFVGLFIALEVKPETVGQFTGLTDKNGKEIYEGDLLRYPAKDQWEENNYSCFEVFFHDGDANTDYNIGYSMNRMYNHGSVCGGYIPSFKPKTVRNMVIIGNIHQNPELLTDKK